MSKANENLIPFPQESSGSVLDEILRDGAGRCWVGRSRTRSRHTWALAGTSWTRRVTGLSFATATCPSDRSRLRWAGPGQAAASPRPSRCRRARGVSVVDPSAVPTQDEVPRGPASLAVPERHQHRRLQRGASGAAGTGCSWPVCLDDHASKGRLGTRIQRLVDSIAEEQALRLLVGGRRVLQHPARGSGQRSPVHPGADGRDGGRQEGVGGGGRRLPGE